MNSNAIAIKDGAISFGTAGEKYTKFFDRDGKESTQANWEVMVSYQSSNNGRGWLNQMVILFKSGRYLGKSHAKAKSAEIQTGSGLSDEAWANIGIVIQNTSGFRKMSIKHLFRTYAVIEPYERKVKTRNGDFVNGPDNKPKMEKVYSGRGTLVKDGETFIVNRIWEDSELDTTPILIGSKVHVMMVGINGRFDTLFAPLHENATEEQQLSALPGVYAKHLTQRKQMGEQRKAEREKLKAEQAQATLSSAETKDSETSVSETPKETKATPKK